MRQQGNGLCQCQHILGGHARLGWSTVNIDLDAHVQRGFAWWALFAQALGNFKAVHGVYPVKVRGDQSGLIALYRSYAVPSSGKECNKGKSARVVIFSTAS